MPNTPQELIEHAGYTLSGSVPWGTRPRTRRPGVYVVSLNAAPDCAAGLSRAPIDASLVERWIANLPAFTLDRRPQPSPALVAARLGTFWLDDEAIVYIGKATSLADRVGQYYRTPLGAKRPHAGGHWIKTLTCLDALTVHYAEVNDGDPEAIESDLLRTFQSGVSNAARASHPQPNLILPFANLEGPGGRRNHGLSGTKES